MDYSIGLKVVCLRDNWNLIGYPERIICPVAGLEYVIRSVMVDHDWLSLRFHWLINPRHPTGGSEYGFAVWGYDGILNFRPVIERKTDISIFTSMLPKTPADVWVKERVP